MAKLETLIKAWDEAVWEFTLVFEGLEDADVWRRPNPRLLSIGELAGHVAYWEAIRSVEPAPDPAEDLSQVPIKSPLVDGAFRYYTDEVDKPVALNLSAAEVLAEFKRVHEESRAVVARVERDTDDAVEGAKGATWGQYVQYHGFHAAYHAGQAYSVRHLFGHTTTDN